MEWYYSTDGETQIGPVSEDDLIKAIKNKKISRTSLIWNEKLNDWKKIEELSLFKEHFKVVPPPLPKQSNDEELESTIDLSKSEDDSQNISFPEEDNSSSGLEEKDGWLPKDLVCPLCGSGVELEKQERKEGKFICPNCGDTVNKGLIEAENTLPERFRKYKVVSQEEKKASNNKNLPTKWLSFYVNVRIPITIILTLLVALGDLTSASHSTGPDVYYYFMGSIFSIVAYGFLFFGLKNRRLWGWKMNWVFIVLETLVAGFGAIGIGQPVLVGLFFSVLFYGLPNYIYFKKRKILFEK